MANLAAIVRATRASASAIRRQQIWSRRFADAVRSQHADTAATIHACAGFRAAKRDYERAQAALAANPLPGDPTC
jgi:hypothetical protein